jgi:LasA protease
MTRTLTIFLALAILLSGCSLRPGPASAQVIALPTSVGVVPAMLASTPLPARPAFKPGELVDYTAQSGDSLPALAARFNTTVPEIMAANPIIPQDATTMPPGLPMKIPIYYKALWGSPYQILPDRAFVNGPALIGFNTSAFVAAHDGWLKDYRAYAGGANRSGAEIVDYVASNFSISPRLLLAILEYQTGALSDPQPPARGYALGYHRIYYESTYLQLVWAANALNNGYYGWRSGKLLEFDLADHNLMRPDPWQNAASVAIQYYFAQIRAGSAYESAIAPDGLAASYGALFNNPWSEPDNLIPGSLHQPGLRLPFPDGQIWTYTGGPHTGWGKGEPFAAIDLAPPSDHSGCFTAEPQTYVVAAADGLIVRSGVDGVALDLDQDGDERTGWVLFYLHIASADRIPLGQQVHTGDIIGYPSCEGGEATGTHVHLARKYNGEWVLADGPLPFVLSGWTAHDGARAYLGTLTKGGLTIRACDCSNAASQVWSSGSP